MSSSTVSFVKRGLVKMGLFDDSFPYLSVISVEWDLGCRWVSVSYHFPCFLHIVTGPKLSGSSDSSHFSFSRESGCC